MFSFSELSPALYQPVFFKCKFFSINVVSVYKIIHFVDLKRKSDFVRREFRVMHLIIYGRWLPGKPLKMCKSNSNKPMVRADEAFNVWRFRSQSADMQKIIYSWRMTTMQDSLSSVRYTFTIRRRLALRIT
jgi:hypothetical protein